MKQRFIQLLFKAKSLVFERYILILLVPLGFLLEFMITSPFMILCALEKRKRK